MSLRFRFALATVAVALICSADGSGAGARQKHHAFDQRQIVDMVSTVFIAACTDDVAKFGSVITSDSYMFDGGARFNGEAIMALLKAQHAAGKRYEWNVTEPDVHISGNTAWIAYVNEGSITEASTMKSEMVGIGLPAETGRHLEDRLHARHPRPHAASFGTMERFLWLLDQSHPIHFSIAAEIEGPTTLMSWCSAFDAVQRRHPFLSVCIDRDKNSTLYFRRVPGAQIPLRVVDTKSTESHWEREVEKELSTRFDPKEAPLIRVVLLHQPNKSILISPHFTPLEMASPSAHR